VRLRVGVSWCVIALAACALAACSANPKPTGAPAGVRGGVKAVELTAEGARFTLGTLPAGWARFNKGDAKIAYRNHLQNQIIMVNVVYAPNRKADLRALFNHLMFDITDRKLLEYEKIMVDEREALWTVVEGELDGAPIKLAAAVVRIDAWVYDLVFVSSPDNFDLGLSAFRQFVQAFHQMRSGEGEE
jgi:hypothetical protein